MADLSEITELLSKHFPATARHKPQSSSKPAKLGVQLNYGDLEGAARWQFALIFTSEHKAVTYKLFAPHPVELKTYQEKQLAGSEIKFDFRRLARELQLLVIEELEYGDLKCLERTSSEMQALVAHRTAILDTALFRAPVNLKALAAFPPLHQEGQETKIDYGENGGFSFHPLLVRAEEMFEPQARWRTIPVRMTSMGIRTVLPLLHTIKEINENATTPPCAQFKMDLWSQDLGFAPPNVFNDRPGLMLVQGARDGKGVVQPVTVAQFAKGVLAAVQSLQPYMPDPGFGLKWVFDEWRTEYMDNNACAHLVGPCWRRTDEW